MRDTLGIVAGYGLLTVTGNEHRQMRKAMNPAFSIPSLMARELVLFVVFYSMCPTFSSDRDGHVS